MVILYVVFFNFIMNSDLFVEVILKFVDINNDCNRV